MFKKKIEKGYFQNGEKNPNMCSIEIVTPIGKRIFKTFWNEWKNSENNFGINEQFNYYFEKIKKDFEKFLKSVWRNY